MEPSPPNVAQRLRPCCREPWPPGWARRRRPQGHGGRGGRGGRHPVAIVAAVDPHAQHGGPSRRERTGGWEPVRRPGASTRAAPGKNAALWQAWSKPGFDGDRSPPHGCWPTRGRPAAGSGGAVLPHGPGGTKPSGSSQGRGRSMPRGARDKRQGRATRAGRRGAGRAWRKAARRFEPRCTRQRPSSAGRRAGLVGSPRGGWRAVKPLRPNSTRRQQWPGPGGAQASVG